MKACDIDCDRLARTFVDLDDMETAARHLQEIIRLRAHRGEGD